MNQSTVIKVIKKGNGLKSPILVVAVTTRVNYLNNVTVYSKC